jgi:hypothetical protein
MNCREFHKGYIVLLDPDSAAPAARAELSEHLKTCRSCAQFYDEIARTVALLRPSTQVNASPQFKESVMNKITQEATAGHAPAPALESRRMKAWKPALAAGIAGLLVCGALLWLKFHSAGNNFAKMPAFSLFRQACAAEESLFKGEGIISIVNEFIVKPISDPALAQARFFPMNSLASSGKLQFDMLALPAKPGEGYTVEDRAWYDQKTGRFARVMTVGHKAIFANSYDGTSVYRLEPDAAGVLKVAGKPVAADFQPPRSPAEFLGLTALLTGKQSTFDEKQSNISDAGQVTLPDGSAARVVKFTWDIPDMPKDVRRIMGDNYMLYTIRKVSNTIAQVEFVMNGESSLVIRRLAAAPVSAPEVPWNLAGIEVQAGAKPEAPKPGIQGMQLEKALPEVSVQQMAEKADNETYLFAADPSWTVERHIALIPDVLTSPPGHLYVIAYCAKDRRHVVLVQSPSYNKILGSMAEGPMAEKAKLSLMYTSPTGFKVWSMPSGQALAPMVLGTARPWTKDPPLADSALYSIKTPAGTFAALAVNGALSDAELHALIDSLIPAKEYVKKFPAAAAAVQSNPAGTDVQPGEKQEVSEVSLRQAVEKAGYETYIFAADPPWTVERHFAVKINPTAKPPEPKFMAAYRAKDGRHVVFVQSADSKQLGQMVEGPMGEKVRMYTSMYTSPTGFKVWSLYWQISETLAPKILESVRPWIKDPPLPDSKAYLVKTPAGAFAMLAVNGALSDAELHALIDSLIPAKEYVKKFPAAASAPANPSNLAEVKGQASVPPEPSQPGVRPDMVLPSVSVQHMVEKADFETYIFAADPPWASKREVTDVLDVASPPQRMFFLSYVAGDHRHVVLIQSPTYNKALGPAAKTGSLAYTSPNGCKVWSGPRGKWLAGILLQSAQAWIKDQPAENRTGYILETPAGTFPTLAINGPVTDAELHALIDSLIPAKEYLKKFPAPANTGAEKAGTTSP